MSETGLQSTEKAGAGTGQEKRREMDVAGDMLPVYRSVDAPPEQDLENEERLLRGARQPTLVVYRWLRNTLVLGRGQPLSDIDEAVCREEGIPVLRRRTGGTAVLHNRTVNISLVLPAGHLWAQSIRGLYTRFIAVVSRALKSVGVPATPLDIASAPRPARSPICFEADSGETLLLRKRKVFGCAQHRLKDAVLVHGTLLLDLDVPQQSRVFKVPKARIERALGSVPRGIDPSDIEDALIQMISTELEMTPVRIGAHYDG